MKRRCFEKKMAVLLTLFIKDEREASHKEIKKPICLTSVALTSPLVIMIQKWSMHLNHLKGKETADFGQFERHLGPRHRKVANETTPSSLMYAPTSDERVCLLYSFTAAYFSSFLTMMLAGAGEGRGKERNSLKADSFRCWKCTCTNKPCRLFKDCSLCRILSSQIEKFVVKSSFCRIQNLRWGSVGVLARALIFWELLDQLF